MPDTTVRVEYIGAVQNFSEVTITGNQQVWRIGSSAFVETSRASQLVASGKFRSLANDPAMLPSTQSKIGATLSDQGNANAPGGLSFGAGGVVMPMFLPANFGRVPCNCAIIGNSLTAGGELARLVSVNAPSVMVGTRAGVGGNTSALVLARMRNDIPGNVDACMYLESVNDVTTNAGQAVHTANVRAIVRDFKSRGILPVILLNGPLNGSQSAMEALYRHIDTLIAWDEKIPVYDPFREFVDPATGYWTSGSDLDGTHPTAATYDTAGRALGTKIANADFANLRPLYNNIAHALLTTNSLLLTDTNSDGIANNWGVIGAGAGVTASLVSGAGDGVRGNWQKLDCVAVTGAKQLYLPNITTGFSAGDEIAVCATLKFDVTSGTPLGFAFMELAGGPSAGRKYLAYQIGTSSAAFATMIRFRVPEGMTGMQFMTQISGTGYSGAISVAEVAIYNLTRLLPVG